MQFQPPSDGTQYKKLVDDWSKITIYLTAASDSGTIRTRIGGLEHSFDPLTVTYSTKQDRHVSDVDVEVSDASALPKACESGYGLPIIDAARNGLYMSLSITTEWVSIVTKSTNRPYIPVSVDDTVTCGLKISEVTPSSGSIIKSEPNTFTWGAEAAQKCIAELKQASAIFRWRSGTSGTIHTISVSGSAQSVTVPANTFTGTTSIQWQVAVTANSGVVTTSDWATLSTADATPTAAPLSPVDTVIDGSKEVLFQWQHSISTGTAQSKADLQKSTDGSTWTTLATVTGAARQWTCPAGTLTSSIKYWRVRTYNADGIAGAWSEAAQIVVIAAPTAPSIQIKSTGPRPSISWQTSEQEAYQVELDGVLSGGTHYGTDKTWISPAYLADGSHTVRVRVQNQYGMWSDWGAAALPVTNTPGAAIALSVQASSVADLSWQTSGSYDFYLVYRNGKPIAKLTQTLYTDELSSGSTTYQVRGCYNDSGNYGLSSAVTVDVRAEVHQVSDLDTGQTLRLPYSDSQHRQTTRTLSRQVELLQLSGAYYPVAVEVDSGTDSLSITAALLDESEIRQLMGLVGKLVCAKTPQGDMVIGYITSLPKQHDGFLNVFNFTVEQIDYDDEVTL
nr:MAG TPA: hypothetical protein [Caudoviricetes sp.]